MRLRRESGDYTIKITNNEGTLTAGSIRKGLFPEALIGAIVDNAGSFEIITSVSAEAEGVITCTSATLTLAYTKDTGAVTATAIAATEAEAEADAGTDDGSNTETTGG